MTPSSIRAPTSLAYQAKPTLPPWATLKTSLTLPALTATVWAPERKSVSSRMPLPSWLTLAPDLIVAWASWVSTSTDAEALDVCFCPSDVALTLVANGLDSAVGSSL